MVRFSRDHLAVADEARLGVAADLARADEDTGDVAQLGRLEDLADLRRTQLDLFELRLEHALEGRLDLLDRLVDDRVVPGRHALALGHLRRAAGRADVKPITMASEPIARSMSDSVTAPTPRCRTRMSTSSPTSSWSSGGLEGLDGTGSVTLDDQVQLLDLAGLQHLSRSSSDTRRVRLAKPRSARGRRASPRSGGRCGPRRRRGSCRLHPGRWSGPGPGPASTGPASATLLPLSSSMARTRP